jgi:predicted RNase H-like nuclease (RuvC/YqgF family)
VTARTGALDATVFGVDVQSGDVRGDAPSYALVVLDGEDGVERDVVSRRKLRRLVDDREPALLATDNVYELAADKDALVHLLGTLPHETTLVQVTGGEQPEPLSRVASRHGVPYGKDPMKEAEASARLAAANVGVEVSAFTDTTAVKVARGRSTGGGGGWSEDRYTRRIHGSVKRRTREVASELDDAGLDYDQEITEKYGGYSRAVFTISAPPQAIPLSEQRSGDTRIEITRERRDGIEFHPLVERRDHVVVGVDPGTTTAAAIVGLDGTVHEVFSSRTVDTADLTEWIIEQGRPVIVAADVTPMPETVEKIRRSFDAAGWTPERDLPVDEKKHRTREAAYEDDHQRDAMAAALSAYDSHEGQFERIAEKVPPRIDTGTVIARVVAGDEPLEAVIEELTASEGEETDESADHEPRELSETERENKRLKRRVSRLESKIEDLEATVAEQEATIEDQEAALTESKHEERIEVRRDDEVTRLRRETERLEYELEEEREARESLEGKLERLKALWKLDHSNFADISEKQQGLTSVKVVSQFTSDAIADAEERFGLVEDDVILFRDASGAGRSTAQRLAAIQPRLVLRSGGLSEEADRILFDHAVPVAPAEMVTVQEVDELAVARDEEVDAAIADWEERAEKRRRDRNVEMVDRLISEHRAGDNGEGA